MSESLRDSWPVEASFNDHKRYLNEGIDVIANNLILPDDGRFQIAYALLSAGRGQKGSVLAIGDPGTGKTKFGDMVFGDDQRVEVSRDDIDDTLYGFTNPIDASETVKGKLKGLKPEDPRVYLNEISHLPNTGSLHRLWDLGEIEIDGKRVPLNNAAIYATSNFPDGATTRVHELDEALRSRIAMEMITGDYEDGTAAEIQGSNAVKDKDMSRTPLLAPAAARQAMSRKLAEQYPISRDQGARIGHYIVDLINELNQTGLIVQISSGDARHGEALFDVARARKLVMPTKADKEGEGMIDTRAIAEVAALVLPRVISLTRVAKSRLNEELGGRRATPMEQAIASRRLVAKTAFETLFESEILGPEERRGLTKTIEKATDEYSYANRDAVDFDVDRAIRTDKPSQVEIEEGPRHGKKLFGRSRKS